MGKPLLSGQNGLLQVEAIGENLTYQWYSGPSGDTSSAIPDGTGAWLLTPPVLAPTSFWVRIADTAGSVASQAALVGLRHEILSVVHGFGSAHGGAMGNGYLGYSSPPFLMAQHVVDIAAVANASFYVDEQGDVWGMGSHPVLSPGGVIPQLVARGISDVSAGNYHLLMITEDGDLLAMGNNASGILGDGTQIDRLQRPVLVARDVTMISAGQNHSLFLTRDGTLWGMGSNSRMPLGSEVGSFSAVPVPIATDVKAISAGRLNTRYIKNDGSLWGLGDNRYGMLGLGRATEITTPTLIATGVAAIGEGGSTHCLYLTDEGIVMGSGLNSAYRLGVPIWQPYYEPTQVITGMMALASGISNSYFVRENGAVVAAGLDDHGQFGYLTDTTLFSLYPVSIDGPVVAVAGGIAHALFLTEDGQLFATGDNFVGQIGDPRYIAQTPQLISAAALLGAAGGTNSFYVDADQNLWGCGSNTEGQLGHASLMDIATFFQMATGVTQIAASYGSTFFLRTDGRISAIGGNFFGQLGIGNFDDTVLPTPVGGDHFAVAVAPGDFQTYFLKANGELWGMGGNNYGQLALGSETSQSATAVLVSTQVQAVSSGLGHVLILKFDGSLWTLGYNSNGQLGRGSASEAANPDLLQVATDVVAIAAGDLHSLFIKNDGGLWAMGAGAEGQLGTGKRENSLMPIQVATDVIQVAAGSVHSIFLKADGSVWTMGDGNYGQLGTGDNRDSAVPVMIMEGAVGVAAGDLVSVVLTAAAVLPPRVPSNVNLAPVATETSLRLQVPSTGTGPFVYEWFRGESGDESLPLGESNGSTLDLTDVTSPGNYWARITNTIGSIDSPTVRLTLAGANDLAAWLQARGLGSDMEAALADPDGDGRSNLAEYFLGTPPDVADLAGTIMALRRKSTSLSQSFALTYRRRLGTAVVPTYQVSADLQTWTKVPANERLLDPDYGNTGEFELVEVTFAESASARLYVQISLTVPFL